MAQTGKAKSTLPYLQRLIEDEFVQEQLRNAAGGVRAAYVRARRQRSQAADDKALYRNLRQAARSIRNATIALRRPEPPPKRRMRNATVIALAIGGTVWLTIKLQKQQAHGTREPDTATAGDSSYTSRADASPRDPEAEHAGAQTAP